MSEIKILDHGYVRYIDHLGSDESIIEAARMSTDGAFKGWDKDEKLLRYLWEHKHTSPFEMCDLVVEVQAPIFVFREWYRHRTQSFNELSGRYTEMPNLYYIPSLDRMMNGGQAKVNKQSSTTAPYDGFVALDHINTIETAYYHSRKTYEHLLSLGVSREIARIVLPLGQYSRMKAKANLLNWLKFLGLRLPADVQWETRQYAEAVASIVQERFPRTYQLFEEGR